jgi:MFS transporter, DHA2 family, glioxin efflux transporter
MSWDKGKTRTSADATSPDLSLAVPSASTPLEEKDNSKTDTTGDNDATDVQQSEYPQGWKLWLVYIATLLTMFLVGFDSILSP